jgi:hypothetical protein
MGRAIQARPKNKPHKIPVKKVTTMLKKIIPLFVTFFVLFIATSGTLEAQEDDWKFGAELYFWYGSIGVDSASGGDVDIDANDLVDALDFGFMTALGAQKGKWSFLVDVIYLDVSDDSDTGGTVPIGPGIPVGVHSNVKLKSWIVTPSVGYSVIQSDKFKLDILAGARYLWMEADLELDISGLPQPRQDKISDSEDVWDGIIGVKGQVPLGKSWYVPYYLDVGTGNSELTWQAMAGIGYKFNKFDVVVAYRYLYWDFDDGALFDNMDINGPLAGVKFVF